MEVRSKYESALILDKLNYRSSLEKRWIVR